MREIEFRGKVIDDYYYFLGSWIYGGIIIRNNRVFIIPDDSINHEIEVNPETIGQYTGLRGKNENKIFEGDIVKAAIKDGEIGDVQFSHGTFGIEWSSFKKDKTLHDRDQLHNLRRVDDGVYKYVTVIGNIHDGFINESGEYEQRS
jgi:uncharacterized phage protein (TIGR01671 family)